MWIFKREREREDCFLTQRKECFYYETMCKKKVFKRGGERRVKTRNFVIFFSSKTIVIFCLKSLSVCLC